MPNRATALAFGSDVTDARAVWLNPAALGLVPLASIMGDITAAEPFDAADVTQWTIAFNSRGLAVGYQHDRFPDEGGTRDSYRLGFGRGDGRTSVGALVTLYRGNGHDTGGDLGVVHRLSPTLRLSAVLSNVGGPELDAGALPLTLEPSLTWRAADMPISVGAGAALTADSLRHWALAVRLAGTARLPLSLLARLDAPRSFDAARITFGLAWGRQDLVQLAVTASKDLDQALLGSLSGVSTRSFGR